MAWIRIAVVAVMQLTVVSAYASPEERWPLSYVLRPQTLPAGMLQVSLTAAGFRPDPDIHYFNATTGTVYQFRSSLQAGLGFSAGLTDRFQASLSLPRLACVDDGSPSACSPNNRFRGSGMSVAYALLTDRAARARLSGGITMAASSPLVFDWWASFGARWLLGPSIALQLFPEVSHSIDPPAATPNPVLVSAGGEVDLQLTERFLLFADLIPFISLDDIGGGAKLEGSGGAAFTFNHHGELALSAGDYNLIAPRRWDRTVPGRWASLRLSLWLP
jgi:hypothetical protein